MEYHRYLGEIMAKKKEFKEGVKHDQGKMRYDLIPVLPLLELAKVYTIGAKKYDDNNWRKGMNFGRIIAALQRHLEKWKVGWREDATDGQHHLSSVMWCAATLIQFEFMAMHDPEFAQNFDDRVKDLSIPNNDGESIWGLLSSQSPDMSSSSSSKPEQKRQKRS
jgi:hypothetical protein